MEKEEEEENARPPPKKTKICTKMHKSWTKPAATT
jgi:hypothetical protein